MPTEFQRLMDTMLGSIPFTNCYLDDILVASKGSFLDHKNIGLKILSILDEYNFEVKWTKCKFFQKKPNGWDSKSRKEESYLHLINRKQ